MRANQIKTVLGAVTFFALAFTQVTFVAQAELDGREIPDGLKVVRAHIDQCRCCKPRYRALIDGLGEILP